MKFLVSEFCMHNPDTLFQPPLRAQPRPLLSIDGGILTRDYVFLSGDDDVLRRTRSRD